LGDTGHGWLPVAQQLSQALPYTKFVLPDAPIQPVTLNMGMRMNSWYDIYSLGLHADEDEDGMRASSYKVIQLLQHVMDEGIPASRIVLGGFSQGCAMALFTALTCEYKLAGVVGLSGYLPMRNKFFHMVSDANRKTRIMLGHGDSDSVVEYAFGRVSAQFLQKYKFDIEFRTYAGLDHGASPEEIQDVLAFLQDVLPPLPNA
jgi:predicted esterase